MTTLPLSEAQARLTQIGDEVHRTHQRVTITKNGRPYLVLMSAVDLKSLDAAWSCSAKVPAASWPTCCPATAFVPR